MKPSILTAERTATLVNQQVIDRLNAIVKARYENVLERAAQAWGLKFDHVYAMCRPRRARRYFELDALVQVAEVEGVGLDWLCGLTNATKDGRPIRPYVPA